MTSMRLSLPRVFVISGFLLVSLATLAARYTPAVGASGDAGSTSRPASGPMTTRERLALSAWWPTRTTADGAGYAGTQSCAGCHASIVKSQARSQMAHTLALAAESEVLRQNLKQQYSAGPYLYSFAANPKAVTMKVSDGTTTRSAALHWAFGSGEVGQSYLWQEDDTSFREARFNYFATLKGFGATPGRLHGLPVSIDMATGRRVEQFEAKSCFACHTTKLSATSPLDTKTFVPGVTCEACHGPGAQHAAAMDRADTNTKTNPDLHIVNAARLSPVESVDFCGACHATSWDVRMMGANGLQTVRFPAYRLEKSRCWGTKGDARITCTGCHDPHAPLERDPAAYDKACLNCHAGTGPTRGSAATIKRTAVEGQLATQQPAHACPVAQTKCVTCHMQKFELPEMHAKFTDHMIRIVRQTEGVPD